MRIFSIWFIKKLLLLLHKEIPPGLLQNLDLTKLQCLVQITEKKYSNIFSLNQQNNNRCVFKNLSGPIEVEVGGHSKQVRHTHFYSTHTRNLQCKEAISSNNPPGFFMGTGSCWLVAIILKYVVSTFPCSLALSHTYSRFEVLFLHVHVCAQNVALCIITLTV